MRHFWQGSLSRLQTLSGLRTWIGVVARSTDWLKWRTWIWLCHRPSSSKGPTFLGLLIRNLETGVRVWLLELWKRVEKTRKTWRAQWTGVAESAGDSRPSAARQNSPSRAPRIPRRAARKEPHWAKEFPISPMRTCPRTWTLTLKHQTM